ncbi:MAG: D-glycero-beta-D-manno-heptose-7-phosphate kinase [Proteobacteria bacterium]|nr:D-glycero-beta-D-manno-heptose-7-phosphate kinase [Desulfobulbaceae bacterium]MBU4152203.1 D-glycero-beta-D-manno-heptose-7-phosphate kinase [Pseudomonadota bacterium]
MTLIKNKRLRDALNAFHDAHILVIGDLIVDNFIWGTVSRISPEAPVPVVNVTHDNLLLGGSANVLHNIYGLGAQATICGVVGQDAMGDCLLELITKLPSSTAGIVRLADRPTTIKTRIVAHGQQVVRFDRESTGVVDGDGLEAIKEFIDRNLGSFQAVIVSDYAKGIIAPVLMDHLRECLRSYPGIPMIVDPKPCQPERFHGATIITPNHHEAEQLSGIRIVDDTTLRAAGEVLLEKFDSQAVLITRGEAGMALFEKGKPLITIPTVAKEVFDVTGAGDTVIAALALGLSTGLSFAEAATLANVAAGIVVGKIGTAIVTQQELLRAMK